MMSLTDEENLILRLLNNQLKESSKQTTFPDSDPAKMEEEIYPRRPLGSKENRAVQIQDLLYQQFVSESEFCDVTLLIDDMKIKAHWCMLVGCPFFQSLHDSGMRELFEENIKLSFGKPWAMIEAIKFLYTGTIEIHYDKIKDLLEAAEYLQINDMKKCCNDYLYLLNITDENCVHLSLLSSLYDLDLYNKAFQYLRGHLPSVLNGEDALTLTKESVLSLLTDETLTYVSLEKFLMFITKWTNQDLENRKEYFDELFLTLNLENIPKNVLEDNLENNSLVSNSKACNSKVSQLLHKYKSGSLVENKDSKDVILLCGGCGPRIYIGHYLLPHSDYMSQNNLFGYLVREKRWTKFAPMPSAIKHPLIVSDDDCTLFIYDKSHTLDSNNYIYQYIPKSKAWSSIKINAPENTENIHIHNLVICQNKLFLLASGMIMKAAASKSVKSWQCFLLEVKKDTGESTIKATLFPRNISSEFTACKIGSQYICVIGTKLGDKANPAQKANSVCISYNVNTNKIKKLPKGCNSDQFIFDYNGSIMTSRPGRTNVKVYSFQKQRWETRRDLAIPLPNEQSERIDYSLTQHNNHFYLFGGKRSDTKEPLKGAMTFSPETKLWEKIEDIPEAVFGSGICSVKLPSDLVQCHVSCPHCIYNTPRSQATYVCFNPDHDVDDYEDDDDDEYSIDDYDFNDFYDDNSDVSFFDEDEDRDPVNSDNYWFYLH